MEERVEAGEDHHSLGWTGDETTAERGQDQRQSRRLTGEVQLVTKQQWRRKWFSVVVSQHINTQLHSGSLLYTIQMFQEFRKAK